jgi:import inner membrane translocase subunit TIM44
VPSVFLFFPLPRCLIHASQLGRATASTAEWASRTTEPLRNTAAYKVFADTIVDALDDSGSLKHAGFEEKEARRARRTARLAKAGVSGIAGKGKQRVKANPEWVIHHVPESLY